MGIAKATLNFRKILWVFEFLGPIGHDLLNELSAGGPLPK